MGGSLGPTRQGRPWHLWLIGIVGLSWSVMGVVSFVLTQMNVEAVMSQFPPQQREYFLLFPWWTVAFWAIGIFAGLAGCVLLLLRNRLAVHVLFASMVGIAVCNFGGLFFLGGMDVMRQTDGVGLTVFPVMVAALLAVYARAMSARRVLI